jgi:hypothetical protein
MKNVRNRKEPCNNLDIVGIRNYAGTYTIIGTTLEPLQTVGSGLG